MDQKTLQKINETLDIIIQSQIELSKKFDEAINFYKKAKCRNLFYISLVSFDRFNIE